MRDDLLYAMESVNWAETNFPSFERAIDLWINLNIKIRLEENNANPSEYLMLLTEIEPFPLKFSVEFGAYINAIRSSLDILATSLAVRFGIPRPDDMYFPIVGSESLFLSRKGFKGEKFINGLPLAERTLIENLKPYSGGNDLLFALHNLDVVRKHKRLLDIEIIPSQIRVMGIGVSSHFTPVASFVRGYDDTLLGFYSKNAPKPDIDLRVSVAITETAWLHHFPVATALRNFASIAKSIIKLFDH